MVYASAGLALSGGTCRADCDSSNRFSFNYASRPASTLSYGTNYTYTATNGLGASRPLTMQVTQYGLTSTQVASNQMPASSSLITGATSTEHSLVFGGTFSGRTGSIAGTTRVITMTVTFSQPVRDFALKAYDIDFSNNQYRDWVQVTGSDGIGTYDPVLLTPWGTGNQSGQPRTSSSSLLVVGPATTPVTVATKQTAGIGLSGANSETGTLTATFSQPLTSITFKSANYPLTSGENSTGQQAIGTSGFSFCPMPSLSLTKSSTAANGDLGAFNVPGNDVIYSLVLTNSGGSSVDAGSVVLTDTLPAGVVFRNLPYDASTQLPIKVILSGGRASHQVR